MTDESIIAVLWERYRVNAAVHLGVLEMWSRGEGSTEEARVAAHKLAGSLGTYGRPEGSRAALELERRLRGGAPNDDADGTQSVDDLLRLVRDALA